MSQKRIMKLATRGKRFAAGMIDFIPITISILYLISGLITSFISYANQALNSLDNYDSYYNSDPYIYHHGISGGTLLMFLIIVYLMFQLYFYSKSQSIGKAIIGLRVVDATTGQPIGFAKMLLREIIVKKASSSILYLGYIWILFDKYNRSWHDKILETYVIDEKPGKAYPGYASFGGGAPNGNMGPNGGAGAGYVSNNISSNGDFYANGSTFTGGNTAQNSGSFANGNADANSGYGTGATGAVTNANTTNTVNPRDEILRNLTRASTAPTPAQPYASPATPMQPLAQPATQAPISSQPVTSETPSSESSTESSAPLAKKWTPDESVESSTDAGELMITPATPILEVPKSELEPEAEPESKVDETVALDDELNTLEAELRNETDSAFRLDEGMPETEEEPETAAPSEE